MNEAKGRFEVKGTPAEASSVTKELGLMHMRFEKFFFLMVRYMRRE